MSRAWETELEIRRSARPKDLSDAGQTWGAMKWLRESQDNMLVVLWYNEVPVSGAPQCLMRGAVQAAANRGLDVSAADRLLVAGQDAFARWDIGALTGLTSLLWRELALAPVDPASPYWTHRLVTTWEEHRAAVSFPAPEPVAPADLDARVEAGWLAQICGGALGSALEGYSADRIAERYGDVTGYLQPPTTYNDDIAFELAFLEAFAHRGRLVTSADVAERWVVLVPFGWSAEHVALANLRLGLYPPESGTRANPFTDWIGAQMRGAMCGLVAPGDAAEAARLAWIDGVVSHAGNGVLGETFNAMLTALAFVRRDVRALVEEVTGLIPPGTQYRWVLDQALAACREAEREDPGAANSPAWAAWRRCEKLLEEYNWVHAYPNAAAEVVALWFGRGDFDRTMQFIARCGLDVDCNAAQVACVLGAMLGPEGIGRRWTDPIGDTLETYVRGMDTLSIKALAARTVEAARNAAKRG